MVKVAYVFTPIEFGGAEKVNLLFLQNVDRNQYEICPIVLTRPWEGENLFIEHLRRANYPIHQIAVAQRPRNEGKDYFRILKCIRRLFNILSEGSFHLIHTHGYFADIIGVPVAKVLKVPHMSTCHGFISNNWNLRVYNWLDKVSLHFCEKIIAVSEDIKSDLVRNGIKKSRIVVIKNAVEDTYQENFCKNIRLEKRQELSIEENEFVIGYVGRLSGEKGVKYLIETGCLLKVSGDPFKILIVGDGPERNELEDLADRKGIKEGIIFAGFQSDVENWLPAVDAFVLPSLTEGTPMSLLEAMACGIPVVASAVGGVPLVVDSGRNGILVAPGKPEEIAGAINELQSNEILRKNLAEEAKRTVKLKYNVDDWVRKIETEYLKTIHKEGK